MFPPMVIHPTGSPSGPHTLSIAVASIFPPIFFFCPKFTLTLLLDFSFSITSPFISLCCAAALHSWRRLQRETCRHPRDPPSDRIPNPHRLLSLLLLLRSPSLLDDRRAEPRYSSTPSLRLRQHSSKIRQ